MSDQSAPTGEATATPDSTESADFHGPQDTQEQAPDTSHEDRLAARLQETMQQALREADQRHDQRFTEFASQFQQDDDVDDEDYLDPDDPDYEAQQNERLFREAVREEAQQLLSPIQEQMQVQERNNAYGKLQEQFPQLQDEQFASDIVGAAAQEAEDIGLSTNSPKFVRLIELHYKAHVADKSAAQETPAGRREEVQLESGGGAAPVDRDEDIQDRILKAAESVSPRI